MTVSHHQLGNQRDRSSRNKHLLVPALVKTARVRPGKQAERREKTPDAIQCLQHVCMLDHGTVTSFLSLSSFTHTVITDGQEISDCEAEES